MSTTPPTTTAAGLLALSAAQIESLVSIDDAIETQRRAFVALATGQALLAPRLLVPGREDSFGFVYSSRTSVDADLVVKVGSLMPSNPARGLDTVSALVLVLDAVTGRPKALLDGAAITDLRTVAASAVAALALCPTPSTVAVIGLGPQGRAHARVLSQVLHPEHMTLWARSATAETVRSLDLPGTRLSGSLSEAVADADLVVLCTTSPDPVVDIDQLKATATVLSLGSVSAQRREVGSDLVGSARLVVDDVDAAVRQAGPLVRALQEGTITRDQLEPIGEVLLRGQDEDLQPRLTYYNSVGVGIQDAAVVEMILDRAAASGAGRTWDL